MKKIAFTIAICLVLFGAMAQKPARLIIRGDDMGYSHSGNEAIIQCYKNGIERSVEVIVPSPWFPEAVKLLQENPGIDVGVHLAITSEWDNVKWRPLSDCPSLKDSNGYFYPMIWPNKNYPGQSVIENKSLPEDIEKEFRAQIVLALKKLPRVTHISAHMGCTNISPAISAITKKLAQEFKIDIDLQEYGVKDVSYIGAHATPQEKIQGFIAMLNQLQPGETYLFLDHPGFDTPELRAIHHIGYENVAQDRQGVTDLFTSDKIKAAIRQKNVQIISYKDLSLQARQ
ncbi:MAG: polysaccharide deacetylase family protein [Bacteroidetes bacterium]|nr:polysaccharide deacetylase family protein [Bacteroidota bacterium]